MESNMFTFQPGNKPFIVGSLIVFHLVSLFAPFCFSWGAFGLWLGLYVLTGLGITLSYHRNLCHKSFKLPKGLEYFFAYLAVHALQSAMPTNVADLENQFFYRFIQKTYNIHPIILGSVLFVFGGFPYIVWGLALRVVLFNHATFFVNSACHLWGNQAWNTGDLSRNNWWVALIAFGEGWHNNHHAFEYSARHGLQWWQLDITWCLIWTLQKLGFATNVKLPSDAQKKRMALIPNNDISKP